MGCCDSKVKGDNRPQQLAELAPSPPLPPAKADLTVADSPQRSVCPSLECSRALDIPIPSLRHTPSLSLVQLPKVCPSHSASGSEESVNLEGSAEVCVQFPTPVLASLPLSTHTPTAVEKLVAEESEPPYTVWPIFQSDSTPSKRDLESAAGEPSIVASETRVVREPLQVPARILAPPDVGHELMLGVLSSEPICRQHDGEVDAVLVPECPTAGAQEAEAHLNYVDSQATTNDGYWCDHPNPPPQLSGHQLYDPLQSCSMDQDASHESSPPVSLSTSLRPPLQAIDPKQRTTAPEAARFEFIKPIPQSGNTAADDAPVLIRAFVRQDEYALPAPAVWAPVDGHHEPFYIPSPALAPSMHDEWHSQTLWDGELQPLVGLVEGPHDQSNSFHTSGRFFPQRSLALLMSEEDILPVYAEMHLSVNHGDPQWSPHSRTLINTPPLRDGSYSNPRNIERGHVSTLAPPIESLVGS